MPHTTIERPGPSRAARILPLAGSVVVIAAVVTWLLRTPVPLLRQQLKFVQFWSLELCVVLGVVFGAAVVRGLARRVTARDAAVMAFLALGGAALTVFIAPHTNRIYYDEQIYQNIGQNLSDLRLAQMCNDGNVEYGRLACGSGEYNKQPYAYPHLLSLAYRAVGVRAATAFAVNAAVMALSAAAVYLLVVILSEDRAAALFAGLLFALMPEQIIWSATAAAEPSASLACILAVVCAAYFVRTGDTAALAATGVATAWAVQFRLESLLVLPVMALVLWPRRHVVREARFGWVLLLTMALLAVHAAHLFAVRHEGWGAREARLSLAYVWPNLQVNGGFYFGDWRFPLAFTVLALAGLTDRLFEGQRLAIASWFLLFFGVFLGFYAGSYNYGADVRYSLMTYAPVAVFGGAGAARVARGLQRFRPAVPAQAIVAAAILFQFLWYAPLVRATTEEAWAARGDVRFARSLAPDLRGNTYVLTHNPGMFHVWGVNAGQLSRAADDPAFLSALAARYAAGVYLHWNFWCNVQDPVQQEFCRKALAAGRFELVKERRERDQRFAFYRLAVESGRD